MCDHYDVAVIGGGIAAAIYAEEEKVENETSLIWKEVWSLRRAGSMYFL